MKALDISGLRFGRLTALHIDPLRGTNRHWVCACECGNRATVQISRLRSGKTKSCGCLRSEVLRAICGKARRRHGHASNWEKTSEYHSWQAMWRRCTNPKHKSYADYGGRGIRVCDRWKDFSKFLEDMGLKPGRGFSIDRIENQGNYEPGNCKWSTPKQQAGNRRSSNRQAAVL
jgi:hypothetical protein